MGKCVVFMSVWFVCACHALPCYAVLCCQKKGIGQTNKLPHGIQTKPETRKPRKQKIVPEQQHDKPLLDGIDHDVVTGSTAGGVGPFGQTFA